MYSEHVISFIDILGYSNLIKEKNYDYIRRCIDVFKKGFEADKADEKLFKRKTAHFSDTIITTIPVVFSKEERQAHGLMYHELTSLALAQASLFHELGILVRGGITIGELFHDDGYLFGHAVVNSYKLEQAAEFPRIVIGEELFLRYVNSTDLRAAHHPTHEMDYEYVKPLIYEGSDRTKSIDYLQVVFRTFDADPIFILTFFQKHKHFIQQGVKSQDSKIRNKYIWLTDYHNTTVNRLFAPEFRKTILI